LNKPTPQLYTALQQAYDLFNLRLFNGELDNSLITLQRQANTYGYMSYNRFISVDDKNQFTHELALNPDYFGVKPLVETLQTMVHEMCHLWQRQHGTPSRAGYHNSEWANKMESIGLMPSNTGRIGGKRVGQSMADYPINGGLFLTACSDLLQQGFIVSWYDRIKLKNSSITRMMGDKSFAEMVAGSVPERLLDIPHLQGDPEEALLAEAEQVAHAFLMQQAAAEQEKPKNSKAKHTCPQCKTNLWGKPSLNVICGKCNIPFECEE
jgi:hypothetical protein